MFRMTTKARNRLYDRVQRVWVCTCLAVTAGSCAFIGWNLFNYFMYIKPIKKDLEEQFKEELLKEGRMLQQKSSLNG